MVQYSSAGMAVYISSLSILIPWSNAYDAAALDDRGGRVNPLNPTEGNGSIEAESSTVTRSRSTVETITVLKKLETAFEERNGSVDNNSGSYGNMFDVAAHRDLEITSLDIHTDQTGFVEVWTRSGGFEEYVNAHDRIPKSDNMSDDKEEDWILISNSTVVGEGMMVPTSISPDAFESVTINKGEIQAFYVTMGTPDIRYTIMGYAVGTPYPASSDLDILIGCGVKTHPYNGEILDSRLWNGIVHYSVTHQHSSSLMSNFANNGLTAHVLLFEIQAFTNINITSFDLHVNSTQTDDIGVATMAGSYIPNNAWISICQASIQSQGRSSITSIPFIHFKPVTIQAHHSQTFMVSSKLGNLIFSDARTQPLPSFTLNDDVMLKLGYALNDQYNPIGNATVWNGIIRYHSQTATPSNGEEKECQNLNTITFKEEEDDDYFDDDDDDGDGDDTAGAHRGIVFDVTATSTYPILLESIQISTLSGSGGTYDVKTREGSYKDITSYFMGAHDSWISISQGVIPQSISQHGSSQHGRYLISLSPSPILIQPNITQSFYISAYTNNTDDLNLIQSDGDPTLSEGNIEIGVGRVMNKVGTINPRYVVNLKGSLYYSTKQACAQTLQPSMMTTSMPSTLGPSFIPTSMPSTLEPSFIPTSMPSTLEPSFIPTNIPSLLPTNIPSFMPSVKPSKLPSFVPTLTIYAPTMIRIMPSTVPSNELTSTQAITYIPTVIATSTSTSTTNELINVDVEYTFNIMYDPTSIDHKDILNQMDASITSSLNTLFTNTQKSSLADLFRKADGVIRLQSVTSVFANHSTTITPNTLPDDTSASSISSCIPEAPNICSVIHSFIVTSYELNNDNNSLEEVEEKQMNLTEGILRYLLYHMASTYVVFDLPFTYKQYIGIQSLFTAPLVTLSTSSPGEDQTDSNMNPSIIEMNDNDATFYENTVQEFLNEIIGADDNEEDDDSSSVHVTGVFASSDTLIEMLLFDTERNRRRKMTSSSSLDISTGIMGEYRPPPNVDFTKLVQESVDKHSNVLVQKLSKNSKFSQVQQISTAFSSTAPIPDDVITPNSTYNDVNDEGNGNTTMIIIIVSSIVGVVLFLACIIFSITRAMSRKNIHLNDIDFANEDHYDSVQRMQNSMNMRSIPMHNNRRSFSNSQNASTAMHSNSQNASMYSKSPSNRTYSHLSGKSNSRSNNH